MGHRLVPHMQVVYSETDLVNDICCFTFGKLLLFGDSFQEIATGNKFHDHVIVFIVFEKLKNTSDVRMVQCFEHLQFVSHQIFIDLVWSNLLFENYLDSDLSAWLVVLGQTHTSERASAQVTFEVVFFADIFDLLETPRIFKRKQFVVAFSLLVCCQTPMLLNIYITSYRVFVEWTYDGTRGCRGLPTNRLFTSRFLL